ncbi:MAG: molybdopterin-dependent oxidoreductase [Propionibacteriales bacterium]|nr:molybdopterin-dependent oxidoreductase [Propionibacteriales bacterium]
MRDHGVVAVEQRSSRVRAGVAGAVSVGAGLGAAEVITGLLSLSISPVIAVGEEVIRLTPGDLAEAAISAVGQLDKPLLVIGTVVGALGLGVLAGVLAARWMLAGVAVLAAMGVVGVFAAQRAADSAMADSFPPVAGAVVSVLVLAYLARFSRPAVAGSTADLSRRAFLRSAGVVAASAVVLAAAGQWLSRGRRAVEAARASLALDVHRPSAPPGVEAGVNGVESWATSNDMFYRIDTALSVPHLVPEEWRLRVHGMVDRELVLTYDDLLRRGLVDAWITLCCVSNEIGGSLISNAKWSGVRVADVLEEAGVSPDADAVLSTSADGWNCGTPLAALTDDRNALLAVAMNGEPLPVEHGFPVRIVVPGLYGFVSATKWVVDIEVTRFADFAAYWTERGWSPTGPVKTQSRIDAPRNGADVGAGKVAVGGIAWAQHTGIDAVEVRVDDGEWQPARLASVPNVDTWRQWAWEWDAGPGDHRLAVRATDSSGETQTGEVAGVVPDGATGWHTISVTVS